MLFLFIAKVFRNFEFWFFKWESVLNHSWLKKSDICREENGVSKRFRFFLLIALWKSLRVYSNSMGLGEGEGWVNFSVALLAILENAITKK